jgi:hypothetical protein
LRVTQSERRRIGSLFVPLDFGDGGSVAGTVSLEQIFRLVPELVEVRPVRPLAV